MPSRMGILHLAIHDAFFAIDGTQGTYLTKGGSGNTALPSTVGATEANQAVAAAAITVLEQQYTTRYPTVSSSATDQSTQLLRQHVRAYDGKFPGQPLDFLSASYRFGIDVANTILGLLAISPTDPGVDQGNYKPPPEGRFVFGPDLSHPVRLVPADPNNPSGPKRAVTPYEAPFYGMTARRLAVQHLIGDTAVEHIIADPPRDGAEYVDAFSDVYRMGGTADLNSTKRRAAQTAAAHFWAYDGANLIGVPIRLYNQILRTVAWDRRPSQTAINDVQNQRDFARLFALANAAQADAGIFAWQEKYCHGYWRPLSGIRLDDKHPHHDPFWMVLGAPATNSNATSFKPPFPAYPSGHATFGAAVMQTMRLYYRQRDDLQFGAHECDNISFEFISDELDGIHRDLYGPYNPDAPIQDQPGFIRTKVVRKFDSLWEAMHENALSRVWLGVHWRFDAFAAEDTLVRSPHQSGMLYELEADGSTKYKPAGQVKYEQMGTREDRPNDKKFPIGGVPLGIGIADDIFDSELRPTPASKQPDGRHKCGDPAFGEVM